MNTNDLDNLLRNGDLSGYSVSRIAPKLMEVRYRAYRNNVGRANLAALCALFPGNLIEADFCDGNVVNPGLWTPSPISVMDGVIEQTPQIEVSYYPTMGYEAAANLIHSTFYCPDGEDSAGIGEWANVAAGSWAVPDCFISTRQSLPHFIPAVLHCAILEDCRYAFFYARERRYDNATANFLTTPIQLHESWESIL